MKEAEIKEFLAKEICSSMYMESSELEDNMLFSDFGLESTTLVKILVTINEKYGCLINVEEFLSHQTLNAASDFIYQKITVKTN